jgi:hypothetical protein
MVLKIAAEYFHQNRPKIEIEIKIKITFFGFSPISILGSPVYNNLIEL